jgi:ribose-phosphate pyrophosphokinase
VRADQVVGPVRGRTPVIVDDMISTGSTIAAAVEVLTAAGARADVLVAATHGVLSGAVADVLAPLPIRRIVLTDTLPGVRARLPAAEVVGVAGLLADGLAGPAWHMHGAGPPPGVASGLLRHL